MAARRKSVSRKAKSTRNWSGRVTHESNALDLDRGVFTLRDPHKIALSLKHSAERSRRRKTTAYRSALSMLIFYINRGGKNLPASRKRVLERAKDELKAVFGKVPAGRKSVSRKSKSRAAAPRSRRARK